MPLTHDEQRRYARNTVLSGVGPEGQEKLKHAKVLVIGAGGLGSPALLYLAAAGVGTLGVVDDDSVDLSNLQRQIIHETTDIGRKKTQSAADAIYDLNPEVQVQEHECRLIEANAKEIIAQYDIVADGSDNAETRFLVHDVCYALKKPLVSAAAVKMQGQLTTFKAYEGAEHPCYHCLYSSNVQEQNQTCEDLGILGAVTGVMGGWQALEVLKELLGLASLSGKLIIFEGVQSDVRKVTLNKDKACTFCAEE